jgi:hypothetical protein
VIPTGWNRETDKCDRVVPSESELETVIGGNLKRTSFPRHLPLIFLFARYNARDITTTRHAPPLCTACTLLPPSHTSPSPVFLRATHGQTRSSVNTFPEPREQRRDEMAAEPTRHNKCRL